MAHEVFISHASEDKAVADAICAKLEAAGIRCWIAPRDIPPGMNWPAAVMQGISACRAMVLVFSASANLSPEVTREVQQAFDRKLVVVPFRLEKVVPNPGLDYYIRFLQWLDAVTPPVEQHIAPLLARLQAVLPGGPDPSSPGAAWEIRNELAQALLKLNSIEYLDRLMQIRRNSKFKADGGVFSDDDLRWLRDYPAELEVVGAPLLAKQVSHAEIYHLFGEQILACHHAAFLWEGEDMRWWDIFQKLAAAMVAEKAARDGL